MSEQSENPNLATRVEDSQDHYIFRLREDVTREKVYYKTRFGIEIAADLYRPADFDPANAYAGIVIGPPFGGVKEQGPGVYANELAARGFIAVAFDPAYHGYSGGEPRYTGSSSMYVEDFCAGVDYLGSLPYIDREKIGVLGICGSGGFAISAASMDTRIKAVVTSALYDIAGNMNEMSGEARKGMLAQMAAMRWQKVDTGEDPWLKSYPDAPTTEIPESFTGDMAEFYEFYGMERGWHPNALGKVTGETMPDLMTLPTTGHIGDMKAKNGRAAPPRTVYVGPRLASELRAEMARQQMCRAMYGSKYEDYNIVIAQEMGRPYEEHDIRKHLKKLCKDNDLPVIVPHAMRHLSVTLKLLWSGDVKSVQADSGHKDAEMVLNKYSHALDKERKKLAFTVDEELYQNASGK